MRLTPEPYSLALKEKSQNFFKASDKSDRVPAFMKYICLAFVTESSNGSFDTLSYSFSDQASQRMMYG